MILASIIVSMISNELIFIRKLKHDCEQLQKLHNDMLMTLSTEVLDFADVVLEDGRLCSFVEAVKLGDVVHLDIVLDGFRQPGRCG